MEEDVDTPSALLALGSLTLGAAAGAAMHRSNYCLTGAFRDLFLFGSTRMLEVLALSVTATMALFEAARLAGMLPRYPFPLLAAPTGAAVLGGLVFGVGMVLAGGCVVGTLYRLGAGSATAGAALLGLLAGSALYAEVHPAWTAAAEATAISGLGPTLPASVGLPPTGFVLLALAPSAALFWRWRRQGRWSRASAAAGFLQPWKASLILALVSLGSYLLAAMPVGVTTCYAKLAAGVEALAAPAHLAGLTYFREVPLDVELPLLGLRLRGGPGPGWDGIAAVQGMTLLGILLGAFGSATLLGEFRPTLRAPPRQLLSALTGGVLLALGSRFANGCNVWHLLGGLPIFAVQSLLFVAGLVPGAWLGSRLLVRLVLRGPAVPGAACGLPAREP